MCGGILCLFSSYLGLFVFLFFAFLSIRRHSQVVFVLTERQLTHIYVRFIEHRTRKTTTVVTVTIRWHHDRVVENFTL